MAIHRTTRNLVATSLYSSTLCVVVGVMSATSTSYILACLLCTVYASSACMLCSVYASSACVRFAHKPVLNNTLSPIENCPKVQENVRINCGFYSRLDVKLVILVSATRGCPILTH